MPVLIQWCTNVAFFAILASCSAQSTGAMQSVSFVVTDCWGNSIQTPTRIHLTSVEPQATQEWLDYPEKTKVALRQGSYHVLIEAQGFFAFSSVIQILAGDVELRNCLTVAPIEGILRPLARLEGATSPEFVKRSKRQWVRLIGVYSDVSLSAPLNSDGGFSFSRLRPGRYILFLVDQSGIKLQKEVDVWEPSTPVRLP